MSAPAVRAGRAYVELFADDSRLVRGLKSAEAKTRAFGQGLARIGGTLAAAGGAVVGTIAAAAAKFASFGDTFNKMAARTGVSVEALSELKFAAEQSGASLETVEAGVRKMQRTIGDAAEGSKSAADALAALGLSVEQLEGLSPEEQFTVLADRISKLSDPTMQAAAAMEIFGRQGTQLLPLFAGGAAGMAALREEARRLGITMSTQDAQAAADYTDAMNRMRRALESAWQAIGAAVAPVLTDLSNRFAQVAGQIRQYIDEHRAVIVTALKVGAAVAAVGSALAGVGAGFMVAANVIGTVTVAVKGLSVAFGFLAANPVVLALAGIAAATALVSTALDEALTPTVELSRAQEDLLDKADRLREADDARMRRLQELSQKQTLSNAESQEAAQLIAELKSRYGDLGLELDATTGSILGAAEAQERLTAAFQKQAEADIRAEIFEHQRNIRLLGEAMDEVADSWMSIWVKESETSKLHREQQAELAKIEALLRRLEALREGRSAAAFGDVPEPSATGLPQIPELASLDDQAAELASLHSERMRQIEEEEAAELARIREKYALERELRQQVGADVAPVEKQEAAEEAAVRERFSQERAAETAGFGKKLDELAAGSSEESAMARAKRLADYEAQLAERLEDLRIGQIEDEEARELARIEAKYAKEREEAQKLGADLAALHEAQEIEIAAVRERFEAERSERRQSAQERIGDEIARNTILRDKMGLDREMALIRLDEQRALREAGEVGIPIDQILTQFALRRQLAAQSYQAAGIAARAEGTFSAEAAHAFGAGSSAVDRIAKSSEDSAKANAETAKNTGRLADAAKFGGLAWA